MDDNTVKVGLVPVNMARAFDALALLQEACTDSGWRTQLALLYGTEMSDANAAYRDMEEAIGRVRSALIRGADKSMQSRAVTTPHVRAGLDAWSIYRDMCRTCEQAERYIPVICSVYPEQADDYRAIVADFERLNDNALRMLTRIGAAAED